MLFDDLVTVAVDYWTTVSNSMPDWLKVKNREVRPVELRQNYFNDLVAADVRRLILLPANEVGASLRRLLQFRVAWSRMPAKTATVS